jgi:Domain of unknown function (DUF4267)
LKGGLFIFILLIGGTTHRLGWFMLAASVIPVGDAVIVLRSNGPKTAVYGIHSATAVVMLAIGVLLLIRNHPSSRLGQVFGPLADR